ncbi:NapC/NirT family cytochrome c [Rhodopseudomonas sp. HC1]|uniref:NapC/NirT family cytochrome c n=1 Tax=Rhodopseudomonas infernalis TaxID=2897386 RepID=UPI001EE81997|nr:NapC/NirT family cytochrome c [Rhodopseudomonas infernalis]MCG6207673.1 NapC/NirT family cytochrome c [Rhodopseudomonas infernalis]
MNVKWMRSPWSLAPVAVLAAIAGVVIWGGFNTAMEATNTLGFCVSCHEMRDNVYQEYKKTVHYQNRTGVRATCSDCHVPRDWLHKVTRKVTATKELYHWAIGSIGTQEKFEAKRHELARHEWDRMRASDSRECRNCHSFEAMDFHKQSAKAASAMTAAMKAGKTCIDCHKGIAHKLPDITARHRAAFAQLAAEAKTLTPAAGATLYAIARTPFRLARAEGEPDGEIAPAAAVTVQRLDGDAVEVELQGWQREGSPEILYQRPSQRVLVATLNETAVEKLTTLETVTDADTDQLWTRARLVLWVAVGGFAPSRDPLWRIGARINDDNCTMCHALRAPNIATANQWIGHVNAMKRFTALDSDEVALLQSYLQNHARDAAPEKR